MYEELKEQRILLIRSWKIKDQQEIHRMKDNNIVRLHSPAQDATSEILSVGAQKLLAQTAEAKIKQLLAQYKGLETKTGHQGVVRNGYLPERTMQTGLGDFEDALKGLLGPNAKGLSPNTISRLKQCWEDDYKG